jgi:thiamine pyrophosphate-dependent acetolactate synthase large subunit-like protein
MNDRAHAATLRPDAASTHYARNGAQALLDALVEADVEVVFGYPSGAVLPIYDALHADHSCTEALPDFVAVAKGFGWTARRVSDPAELDAALIECLASDTPYFLDVVVEPEENCFPMFAAGAGHHEVMLGDGRRYQPRA